jgi:hypothetical protein
MLGALEANNRGDWLAELCWEVTRADDFCTEAEDGWLPSYARVHFDNAWGCFRDLGRLSD